eukprot:TRINITY_DN66208_c7_g1_i1.p1 TRINITY_DN66208_c7_g1~~TRINITY_DN66208_c7_g1_i1.p1  ORF type:complete len:890 (+),score=100.54 TRINITY_DN66208_c7_g1_i1:30-2699(+)
MDPCATFKMLVALLILAPLHVHTVVHVTSEPTCPVNTFSPIDLTFPLETDFQDTFHVGDELTVQISGSQEDAEPADDARTRECGLAVAWQHVRASAGGALRALDENPNTWWTSTHHRNHYLSVRISPQSHICAVQVSWPRAIRSDIVVDVYTKKSIMDMPVHIATVMPQPGSLQTIPVSFDGVEWVGIHADPDQTSSFSVIDFWVLTDGVVANPHLALSDGAVQEFDISVNITFKWGPATFSSGGRFLGSPEESTPPEQQEQEDNTKPCNAKSKRSLTTVTIPDDGTDDEDEDEDDGSLLEFRMKIDDLQKNASGLRTTFHLHLPTTNPSAGHFEQCVLWDGELANKRCGCVRRTKCSDSEMDNSAVIDVDCECSEDDDDGPRMYKYLDEGRSRHGFRHQYGSDCMVLHLKDVLSCDKHGKNDCMHGYWNKRGNCVCHHGFWGSTCDGICSCSDNGHCDQQSGRCMCNHNVEKGHWGGEYCNRCLDGWTGRWCKEKLSTPPGQCTRALHLEKQHMKASNSSTNNALDGDEHTEWVSEWTSAMHYFSIDVPSDVYICTFKIHWGTEMRVVPFDIYYKRSVDAPPQYTAHQMATLGGWQSIPVDIIGAQWVGIRLQPEYAGTVTIKEFQVYGLEDANVNVASKPPRMKIQTTSIEDFDWTLQWECNLDGTETVQDGHCRCTTGYWGLQCERRCSCNNHGGCNQHSGDCECFQSDTLGYWEQPRCNWCLNGWTGADCNEPTASAHMPPTSETQCKETVAYNGNNIRSSGFQGGKLFDSDVTTTWVSYVDRDNSEQDHHFISQAVPPGTEICALQITWPTSVQAIPIQIFGHTNTSKQVFLHEFISTPGQIQHIPLTTVAPQELGIRVEKSLVGEAQFEIAEFRLFKKEQRTW